MYGNWPWSDPLPPHRYGNFHTFFCFLTLYGSLTNNNIHIKYLSRGIFVSKGLDSPDWSVMVRIVISFAILVWLTARRYFLSRKFYWLFISLYFIIFLFSRIKCQMDHQLKAVTTIRIECSVKLQYIISPSCILAVQY